MGVRSHPGRFAQRPGTRCPQCIPGTHGSGSGGPWSKALSAGIAESKRRLSLLGLRRCCRASRYWREPSQGAANGADCQWAPEAWLPRSAAGHLEPPCGLACANLLGFGLERGDGLAVAIRARRGCLFTRGWTRPCQPRARVRLLFRRRRGNIEKSGDRDAFVWRSNFVL